MTSTWSATRVESTIGSVIADTAKFGSKFKEQQLVRVAVRGSTGLALVAREALVLTPTGFINPEPVPSVMKTVLGKRLDACQPLWKKAGDR